MAQSELEKTNSSSGEEEESSESSESESEDEKTPPPPPFTIKTQGSSKSSPEECESDADSPPKKSEKTDPNIKPLASKPIDDEPLRKPRPKNPISRYSPPPLKSVTGKRKASEVESEARESKIEKEVVEVAKPGLENAGEKKQLFQRLWSEDDEIELIKGMINYVEEKGKDPIADVNDFHKFVKNSLHIDVNNAQMSAKVKRLKKKFMNNVGKIKLKGKVRSLSNPHEKKMYEFSKMLWGSDRNKNAAVVSCSTKKVNATLPKDQKRRNSNFVVSREANVNGGVEVSAVEVGQNVVQSDGGLGGLGQDGVIRFPITDEDIVNKGLGLVSGSKKVELEEKWNNLKVQELKHFLKKLELLQEQAELVLSAIKKSDSS